MAESPTNRRDFLKGKSAVEALGSIGDALPAGAADPGLADCTLSLTRRAMACDFQVQLIASPHRNETEPALAALDLIDEQEDRLSVYRDSSDISLLNNAAQFGPAETDAEMFALLELCDQLHRETEGAFDTTTGPLSKAWGFYQREPRVPSDEQLAAARELVGWSHVKLDADTQTLAFDKQGIEVNFNGVGKGHALDLAAEQLGLALVDDFLMHGGRSTLVARGNRPGGQVAGWGVALRHPLRPQLVIAEFALVDQAFSTSGAATQGFVSGGERYGHILDARTGRPAVGPHSVSVIAPTGAEADALSTAFYVLGPERSRVYCEAHPGVGAAFVMPGQHANQVRLEVVHLPADRWRQVSEL
ncbi:Thiamine biosynthesis lipoprotein ApbE precursor [Posidoniimonas polymericola]|uniref:FAD:protein FMN transferase n=1 Tax=Posidoniimonas polymericola TaxID=2528002 RepID=A0A5C5ZFE0_9BACT|nr:FAD:protein FMN transferase [Posidoniimonas polymericola]TWT85273.1 Thiamine biosynthesis lipoprotein ApbE precursor [Posidoniimonas polymericola]